MYPSLSSTFFGSEACEGCCKSTSTCKAPPDVLFRSGWVWVLLGGSVASLSRGGSASSALLSTACRVDGVKPCHTCDTMKTLCPAVGGVRDPAPSPVHPGWQPQEPSYGLDGSFASATTEQQGWGAQPLSLVSIGFFCWGTGGDAGGGASKLILQTRGVGAASHVVLFVSALQAADDTRICRGKVRGAVWEGLTTRFVA